MAWATPAETLSLTGVSAGVDQIAQAQGVIEVLSGFTLSTPSITGRNARLLKSAVAYQAAWMVGQVDVTTRTDVSQSSQDGASFTLAHPDALILAPLARRCLDRLMTRRARSARVWRDCDRVEPFGSAAAVQAAFLADRPGFVERWRSTQ